MYLSRITITCLSRIQITYCYVSRSRMTALHTCVNTPEPEPTSVWNVFHQLSSQGCARNPSRRWQVSTDEDFVWWGVVHERFATPRKDAFLPCGHLDFESAVTAQRRNQGSFDSSYSRSLNVKTQPRTEYLASILSDKFDKCICRNISCALGKWSLHSRWNLSRLSLSLHVHGDERWPIEVTSNTYFRGVEVCSLEIKDGHCNQIRAYHGTSTCHQYTQLSFIVSCNTAHYERTWAFENLSQFTQPWDDMYSCYHEGQGYQPILFVTGILHLDKKFGEKEINSFLLMWSAHGGGAL